MDRIELVQNLINKNGYTSYLEIGVNRGFCFFNIRCKNKIAVDPKFEIPTWRKILYIFKNKSNIRNKYYEQDSDTYFKSNTKKFELIFIDGLHSFDQSYQDIINALQYLDSNGTIVVHDCNPITEASAQDVDSIKEAKNHPDYKGDWSGAVWKSIIKLRLQYPNISVNVVDTDHGLGIIMPSKKSTGESLPSLNIEELKYKDLKNNRIKWLNLISTFDFIRSLND